MMETRTLDNDSIPSLKGDLSLSARMLEELEPGLKGWRGRLFDLRLTLGSGQRLTAREVFDEHLRYGDAAPALVVSVAPFRIAAYTNELDAVIMLRLPDALAIAREIEVGARMIAVSTYAPMDREQGYARDIIPGPHASGHFSDAAPLIADLLSEEHEKLERYKRFHIPEEEWSRVEELAVQYQDYFGDRSRDGSPIAVCFS